MLYRLFVRTWMKYNLQSSGYAVLTIRENMDEVLSEQGSSTLPSKYLYIMQIHVNSGYEKRWFVFSSNTYLHVSEFIIYYFWSICR